MKSPIPSQPGVMAEVVAPYCDGGVFIEDFWMMDRVGAMAGASLLEYAQANSAVRYEPRHVRILGPDVDNAAWPDAMVSAADAGWMDGSGYQWEPGRTPAENLASYNAAGCPTKNQNGEWGAMGYPMSYIRWTWENPRTRGPSPLPRGPGNGGRR